MEGYILPVYLSSCRRHEVSGEGQPVQQVIALKEPGQEVELTILREGKRRIITVTLGQRETGREKEEEEEKDFSGTGLEVGNLTRDILRRLRHDACQDEEGVIVTEVERYSNAAEAGIRPGDLITRIEDHRITSVSDCRDALDEYQTGEVVIFYLKRREQPVHAFVKMPE